MLAASCPRTLSKYSLDTLNDCGCERCPRCLFLDVLVTMRSSLKPGPSRRKFQLHFGSMQTQRTIRAGIRACIMLVLAQFLLRSLHRMLVFLVSGIGAAWVIWSFHFWTEEFAPRLETTWNHPAHRGPPLAKLAGSTARGQPYLT